jgi:hypothetical protein
MAAVQTSETSVNSYQSTRSYNPGGSHLHTHLYENLESYYRYLFKNIQRFNVATTWTLLTYAESQKAKIRGLCSFLTNNTHLSYTRALFNTLRRHGRPISSFLIPTETFVAQKLAVGRKSRSSVSGNVSTLPWLPL